MRPFGRRRGRRAVPRVSKRCGSRRQAMSDGNRRERRLDTISPTGEPAAGFHGFAWKILDSTQSVLNQGATT
jgi:hypothetical protein